MKGGNYVFAAQVLDIYDGSHKATVVGGRGYLIATPRLPSTKSWLTLALALDRIGISDLIRDEDSAGELGFLRGLEDMTRDGDNGIHSYSLMNGQGDFRNHRGTRLEEPPVDADRLLVLAQARGGYSEDQLGNRLDKPSILRCELAIPHEFTVWQVPSLG